MMFTHSSINCSSSYSVYLFMLAFIHVAFIHLYVEYLLVLGKGKGDDTLIGLIHDMLQNTSIIN